MGFVSTFLRAEPQLDGQACSIDPIPCKHHRIVYRHGWQEATKAITTFAGTGVAGRTVTRRSTSGGCLLLGKRMLKIWPSTQRKILLSSGEAELQGLAKATTHALGFRNMANNLGLSFGVELFSDAVAAIGVARRRSAGQIRNLD